MANLRQKLPATFQKYFWDCPWEDLDVSRHKNFIIERVLQYGFTEDVRSLLSLFSKAEIIHVVKNSKRLDRKTANFWALHYNIEREHITCLNRSLIDSSFY